MKKINKNEARNKKWLKLYESGMSMAQIANSSGYCANTVWHALNSICPNGIPLRGGRKRVEHVSSDSEYMTIPVYGKKYVMRNFKRLDYHLPQPDFMGMGMALCGILNEGETTQQWIDKHGKSKTNSAEDIPAAQ